MSLPLIPLLQRQLETTLQLLISALPAMSTDDVMLVRIRLNEADIVIGNAVVDRSDSTANADALNHPSTSATAAPQNVNTTSSNSGRNRTSAARTSTSRRAVDRRAGREIARHPITRSTTRASAAIRGFPGSQHGRNRLVPLIDMDTDSDED